MALVNLFGEPMMSPDLKSALDEIKDKEVLEAVLYVRRGLWELSSRGPLDSFDAVITSLKLDWGTPDTEMAELLANGLDVLAQHMEGIGGPRLILGNSND